MAPARLVPALLVGVLLLVGASLYGLRLLPSTSPSTHANSAPAATAATPPPITPSERQAPVAIATAVPASPTSPLATTSPSPAVTATPIERVAGWRVLAGDRTGPGVFNGPSGVATDRQGNVYVADTENHRIQKLSPNGQPLAQWGTRGAHPGQFEGPVGVAVDGQGNVFVTDLSNHRIQEFSPANPPTAREGAHDTDARPAGLASPRDCRRNLGEVGDRPILGGGPQCPARPAAPLASPERVSAVGAGCNFPVRSPDTRRRRGRSRLEIDDCQPCSLGYCCSRALMCTDCT